MSIVQKFITTTDTYACFEQKHHFRIKDTKPLLAMYPLLTQFPDVIEFLATYPYTDFAGLTFEGLKKEYKVDTDWEFPGDYDLLNTDDDKIKQFDYNQQHWVPLFNDAGTNYMGVDLDPHKNGTLGQIIVYGHDEDERKVIATSFAELLQTLIHLMETKRLTSERRHFLNIVYCTYFFDGHELSHLHDVLKVLV